MFTSTISGINRLPNEDKREIFSRMVPPELLEYFGISAKMADPDGNVLMKLNAPEGKSIAEMSLFHKIEFPDPVLYGQIADTMNGQFHIMLYILNDPEAPRFNVDRLADGTPTQFGILHRNLEAERAAMDFGLAPGQIRKGLRLLGEAIQAFEGFLTSLGHDLHFVEPLFYHNAILFERYGYAYERGRRLMECIQAGFSPQGDLLPRLDGSTPFRNPEAAASIRLRSWAIHDGLLGEPFTNVTMYKRVGALAGVSTCNDCQW
ncbi:MAG: hypothetical protein EHM70_13315 [Chloroflexota bacterium]|nr:MAG: hypothetical protein EHM70_13315 [Chloroflexota bacterium]